ncbi:extra-large guanine nucleotide-binding protein 1 [Abeliophyllum distichum]|uniref:Extra-large guanine nucleotide-binding protein 1 n=1 Tax=Abeliophyllum distichum TaxID=126358 RepID=A0ABD1QG88_9LAMI
MISVLRSIFPASSSTSMEYSSPPVRYDILQGVLVDVRCIPTTVVAAKVLSNLSLPVIQPIVKSKFESSEENLSRKLENRDENSSSSGTLGFWKIATLVPALVEGDEDWSSIA